MGITTKTGDSGFTSLGSGERVRKDSSRVEALGTLDELDSFIGEARHWLRDAESKRILPEIQADLFRLAALVASPSVSTKEPFGSADSERLLNYILRFETELDLKGFVIPGSTMPSAKLDICRTVARRAERRLVALSVSENLDADGAIYLNRLSDLLFVLARREEKLEGKLEYVKKP